MSNNSLPITPNYGGDEYNRILIGIPLEEDSSSEFFSPAVPRRNEALIVISPVPRPITPRFGGSDYGFPLDLSPCGQRFDFEQWSPPAIMSPIFRYAPMTPSEDSGYLTHQESQLVDWHHVSSPQYVFLASPILSSPSTPALSRQQFSPRQHFPHTTPTPPRRDVLPIHHRCNLDPANISPDMFSPTTPRPITLRVRNDLLAVTDSQSCFSPSILQLVPYRSTLGHEQSDAMEWGDDGNGEELNVHMDKYEGWGSDYEEINELIIRNIK